MAFVTSLKPEVRAPENPMPAKNDCKWKSQFTLFNTCLMFLEFLPNDPELSVEVTRRTDTRTKH